MRGERIWKQALERGYLSVDNTDVGHALAARYREWCRMNGWPYITATKKRETAAVEVDMRASRYSLKSEMSHFTSLYTGAIHTRSIKVRHRPFIRINDNYILCTNIPLHILPELIERTIYLLQRIQQDTDARALREMSHIQPYPPFVTTDSAPAPAPAPDGTES